MHYGKYIVMAILILSILNFNPSATHAQDYITDLWQDLPDSYMDYEVIETSLVIKTSEGLLYRISKIAAAEDYSIYMVDSSYFDMVPVYWGEDHVNALLIKIREMWQEVKTYAIQILEKVKEMMGLVGMILIFVCAGVLTYFLSVSFPAFPSKWVFYAVFSFLCVGWIYLTSVYSSVIYASGILVIPHLLIALLGLGYRKTKRRFKKNKIYLT